jgi:iron complex outermembrane receptor protein
MGKHKMNRKSTLALAVSVLLASRAGAALADLEAIRNFDIPPQPLASALLQFSRQADVQVVGSSDALTDLASCGVNGRYTGSEALRRLLGGNPISFEPVTNRSVRILPQEEGRVNKSEAQSERRINSNRLLRTSSNPSSAERTESTGTATLRLAQGSERKKGGDALEASAERSVALEEITVTGSHIRGAENLSSPTIRFDRLDIEQGAYATVQDLIQSLPQNLNNVSDMTFAGMLGGPSTTTYDGSGVNLRGLGGDSTLVLLNGRRLPSAGQGEFVDISLIPLSAIERVDVLTDGASAIYGSDAVGGVVNFVLRDDLQGAETRLRYGKVTSGDYDERQAAQMFGGGWNSGHALISYEYYQQSRLSGSDRAFIDNTVYDDLELVPKQRRQSVLAMISQQISDRMQLSAEVLYSERESGFVFYQRGLPPVGRTSDVEQYGGSMELKFDLVNDWEVRLSGNIGENTARGRQMWVDTRTLNWSWGNTARAWSGDLAADGPIFSLPGGVVRVALGAQFRGEDFEEGQSNIFAKLDRDVSAVYAELRAPWFGRANRRAGMERLELTLAGRFEDYSDFGSTFNPKVGLAWSPVVALNVRATWGTSFKAPRLSQMNPADWFAYVYEEAMIDADGPSTALVLEGSGVNLGPEESTNRTVGFDLTPQSIPGLRVSGTYFEINYTGRVRYPLAADYPVRSILLDPQYQSLISRDPDPGLAALLGGKNAYCITPQGQLCNSMPSFDSIDAFVDLRDRNLAAVKVKGVDVIASYTWVTGMGRWAVDINAARLLRNREQIFPGAPTTDELNTVYRPVDLRLRGGVSFNRGDFNSVLSLTYVDDYRDTRVPSFAGPNQRPSVASWTTLDLTLQYDLTNLLFEQRSREAIISLSASNLLDRDPPFVSQRYGLNYDGVNANPMGRFLSAQIVARW